ncbi:hypothetical protein [Lolliginicoccus suaedae]|uniref:hypothetical protein n=1 Tax=Lolliginicoccus suaedae TaxID=2605429 RepID=UPI0011EC61E6|nr:hypothetical protein [Lolliginicoccus suaedae]
MDTAPVIQAGARPTSATIPGEAFARQRCMVIGAGYMAWREQGRIVRRPTMVRLRGSSIVVGDEHFGDESGPGRTEAELLDAEPDPLEFLDDPVLAFSSRTIPMPAVIDALARHARLDAREPLDTLVIVHPTWWPAGHRRALASAMRRYASVVQLVSVAVACAADRARRFPGESKLVVVENDGLRRVETILGIGASQPRVLATSIDDPDAVPPQAAGVDPAAARVDATGTGMEECLLDGAAGLLPAMQLQSPPSAWGSAAHNSPAGRPQRPQAQPSWASRSARGGLALACSVLLLGGAALLLAAFRGGADGVPPVPGRTAASDAAPTSTVQQPRSGYGTEATIGDLVITLPEGWGMGWSDFADHRDPGGFLAELLPFDHADERRILIARRGPGPGIDRDGIAGEISRLVESDPRLEQASAGGTGAEAAYREVLVDARGAVRGNVTWFVLLVGGRQANIGCESSSSVPAMDGAFPECLELAETVRHAG